VVLSPSADAAFWYGLILPAALIALLILVVALWLRRGGTVLPAAAPTDAAALDRDLRSADLRFGIVSGVLVALSGMSVLYVAHPTFGTPGDYLTVALWGTGVGEGLQLARRLLPPGTLG